MILDFASECGILHIEMVNENYNMFLWRKKNWRFVVYYNLEI